ncbi:phosphoadenosine phosphosulfate reductase [Actinoplanes sp. NPDC049668]|uniref:phosphoadenosine phosphosulfate reductase n=1 Tax=unclassified Actinoplanes TaxID=2626549 RepID=UPI00339FE851
MSGTHGPAPEPVREPGPAAGLKVVAYGGGVQSTALLVLAATGRIDVRTFVFANVGNDSEHPATLAYLRQVARPYAQAHGLDLVALDRVRRDGTTETLYGRLTRPGSRSLPIPVRMSNGAPGTRSCTADFKIRVMGRWLRQHGATAARPATVAVGISLDEIHRAHNRREQPHERVVYPLLDLRLDRSACLRIITDAGLPAPGKSACWFCPFTRPQTWAERRRDDPALFARACDLESTLNVRRARLGRDPVWLTRFNRPLSDAVPAAQDTLPGLDAPADDITCDNGACWT